MKSGYHPFSSLFIAIAVWLAMIPMGVLIDGRGFLIEVAPVLAASGLVGVLLGLLRAPRMLTLLSQVVAVVGVLAWRGLALAGEGEPLAALNLLTQDGVAAIRDSAPPLAPVPGLLWLTLLLAALLVVVLELLVNALEQPGWAIAPLALTFGISALIVRDDLPWPYVVPVVAGYLIVLLSTSGAGQREATGKVSRMGPYHASRIAAGATAGVLALALALLIAPAVPMGDKQPWNNAGNDGPIELSDPTIRLNQDLRRPADSLVLTYRSSDEYPHYIRTVALPDLTTGGARLLPMRLSRFGLDGAYDYPGERVTLDVQMASVPSEYLPAPFAVDRIDADGQWSFDPDTLSIVASGDERMQQTVDLSYSVESVVPRPSKEDIEAAGPGTGLAEVTTRVPDGLDPAVLDLTRQVVADAQTSGQAALAIQNYLRSDAFTYSLEAPNEAGLDTLSAFLLEDQTGYCIHFAAAMMTMARIEGIPSRMAVGFTPGERQEDGSYEVTAHDAHAWPELYLDGLGWVPFEPTPAFDGPPGYTDPATQPTAPPTDGPSPSTSPTAKPTTAPTAVPSPTDKPVAPSGSDGGGALGIGIAVALLVLALLAAPAVVRVVQRTLRLRGGRTPEETADAAWREVRATFTDYGLEWPAGSPGPAARAAAEGLPPQGAAALTALADGVERSRFSRSGAAVDEMPGQVRALQASVRRAAKSGARLKAVLLPSSLWSRR